MRETNLLSPRIAAIAAAAAAAIALPARAVDYQTFTNYQPYIAGGPVATAWYGDKVAIVIQGETNPAARDMATMQRIVSTFDNIVTAYEGVVGRIPSHSSDLNGHIRIEIPTDIGGGLGGHGTYGFAVDDAFFNGLYSRVQSSPASPQAYDQVFFYELSRNFWTADLNPRVDYATSNGPADWGWWTVGFNNAMSALMPRNNIEGVSDMYYFGSNGASFSAGMTANVDTYTANAAYTWDNSWDRERMPWNQNTSLNDLMTGTLIKLYETYGGIRVMEGFYREMPKLQALANWPADPAGARDNFYLAASRACDTDLRDYFTKTQKWTLSAGIRPFTDFTWTGTGSKWNAAGGWTSSFSTAAPAAEYDRAFFGAGSNRNVDLAGNQLARAIKFTAAATGGYVLSNSVGGAALTLGDGGNITKDANTTTSNQTISSPIKLAGDAIFANNNGWVQQANKLVLSGNITGGDRIRVSGTGLGGVELSGDNSGMTGEIIVESGMLLVGSNTALGTTSAPTTLAGGQLWLASGVNTPENFVIAADSTQSSLDAATMSGSVKVNLAKTFTLTNGGGNPLTMSGALTGEGNLTFSYANTTLGGSARNTLSGTIAVTANSGIAAYNELHLAKTGGATAIAGSVVLTNKAALVLDGDDQIADAAGVTLNGVSTVFRLAGHHDTVGSVLGGASGSGIVENAATSEGTLGVNTAAGVSTSFAGTLRDGTVNGIAGSALNFTKSGSGRQTLTGSNTFTGMTTVNDGVLALGTGGSLSGTREIYVNGGTFLQNSTAAVDRLVIINQGTIGGTGTYSGNIGVNAGHVSPGDGGAGTVTFIGGLALSPESVLDFDLAAPSGKSDAIKITGGILLLDGTLNINALSGFGTPGTYTLFSGFGSVIDSGLNISAAPAGMSYRVSTTSNAVLLTVAVPEPASLAMLGIGTMLMTRRRPR